jgi:Rieske Fe-S protein
MKCTFCNVPNVKFRGNASFDDLKAQLYNALRLFPSVNYTERLNLQDCPCHGSRFDSRGKVLRGPARVDVKEVQ